ncbi:MAG: tRNA-dihydrouridine synthase [Candidatus Kerfeldbacteria bacterium]|nr:tRNA-dihydrouridine synthase [Candidatus Kerfeldbacteria bacterium]
MRNVWAELPKPLIYMAPMSGVTNLAYRKIVKHFGADIVFPEFVSTYALHYNSAKTIDMLRYEEVERPIIAQIFGSEPEYFREAAKMVVDMGFDGVDINFGCPAPKVAKNGGGCALLGDLPRSRAIIEATLEAVEGKVPVSVKTRVSYRDTHVREFAHLIKDLPLANLCIHGRPFEKAYVGAANLDCIKEVKQIVPFMVTASGNAHTPEAAKHTLDYTGADGVALARATFGRPWIGKQIRDYLNTGTYQEPTFAEVLDVMRLHAKFVEEMCAGYEDVQRPFIEMRKVLGWYVHGIPGASQFRAELVRVSSLDEVDTILERIRTTTTPELLHAPIAHPKSY